MSKKYFEIERKSFQNLPAQIVTFYESQAEADIAMLAGKFGSHYKAVEEVK